MALQFAVVAAPDAHIAFLQAHPGLADDYLEGVRPEIAAGVEGWPATPPASMGSWGVNHRNTELYHWILNGSPEPVTGAGTLFQVWHDPGEPGAAIPLDPHNVRFAMTSDRLPELAALVARVDIPAVRRAFSAYSTRQGRPYEPDDMVCESFVDEFRSLGQGLSQAMAQGLGIVW